jgi:hypothetical protein
VAAGSSRAFRGDAREPAAADYLQRQHVQRLNEDPPSLEGFVATFHPSLSDEPGLFGNRDEEPVAYDDSEGDAVLAMPRRP